MTRLALYGESFPLAQTFTISRGSKTTAEVFVVELSRDGHTGRGESVPYPRYDETIVGATAAIEALRPRIEAGTLNRASLQDALSPGAARNALDCALWDLEAKLSGQPVHQLAGLCTPHSVTTAYTLSLAAPEAMGQAAAVNADRPLLKIKLGGDGSDLDRIEAIRANAPDATLIVDANEGWSAPQVEPLSAELAQRGVALIEQPLPAGQDALLAELEHPVPLCADESCHTTSDLEALATRYECVNLKLDKTGGLTEALLLVTKAKELGLELMVGCMVATSLAMAPAALLAPQARYVDLDGPLLLKQDREHGLHYDGSLLHPPQTDLWG
ncbi:MAG: dipeptide epimerase [Gemmatimonadetes bacterium]|nr:dipeptide epimerase [Gemmatimonadota bacterium]MBT5329776.1 dipeptide epimerase [Gemmatimonadota bacterium]MBT5450451.1 dipeptide epimerase [Gemmatimonadota bacterium]MBT5805159.1 dipeptide epimerase [Gemmatimonadota bacterium]MBT6620625.1 dipeptide epimerase [Gemmatimonadota bacterium]